MKRQTLLKTIVILCAYVTTTEAALATPFITIRSRCDENNLDNDQGRGRNLWAMNCFPGEVEEISAHSSQIPLEYALVSDESEANWNAPTTPTLPCSPFTKLHAFCVASCYTPEQRVLFEEGYVPIGQATERLVSSVVTLRSDSGLGELLYQSLAVESYTRSWRDASEVVRTFEMESGGRLRVTLNHPLVTSEGMVKPAFDVEEGEALIKDDGSFDPIVSTHDELFFGRVYNVAPVSNDPVENIIVAESYLNGSANYQYNQAFVDLHYRKMLRQTIDL